MMFVADIQSIELTAEEAAKWPAANEICPKCGEPFGDKKVVKDLINGERVAVHRSCSNGSYLRK